MRVDAALAIARALAVSATACVARDVASLARVGGASAACVVASRVLEVALSNCARDVGRRRASCARAMRAVVARVIAPWCAGVVACVLVAFAFAGSVLRVDDATTWARSAAFGAYASAVVGLTVAMDIGCDRASIERVFVRGDARGAREIGARSSVIGGVAGAWVGAVPAPLDWNRAWQEWPVSCVRGMSAGFACGALVGVVRATRFGGASTREKTRAM